MNNYTQRFERVFSQYLAILSVDNAHRLPTTLSTCTLIVHQLHHCVIKEAHQRYHPKATQPNLPTPLHHMRNRSLRSDPSNVQLRNSLLSTDTKPFRRDMPGHGHPRKHAAVSSILCSRCPKEQNHPALGWCIECAKTFPNPLFCAGHWDDHFVAYHYIVGENTIKSSPEEHGQAD